MNYTSVLLYYIFLNVKMHCKIIISKKFKKGDIMKFIYLILEKQY